MKKFIISEEEKKRILGMHIDAARRQYSLVSEQGVEQKKEPVKIGDGFYILPGINSEQTLSNFVNSVKTKQQLYTYYPNYNDLWKGNDINGLLTMSEKDFNPELTSNGISLLKSIKQGLIKIAEQGKLLTTNELASVLDYEVIPMNWNGQEKVDTEFLKNVINVIAQNVYKKMGLGTIPTA